MSVEVKPPMIPRTLPTLQVKSWQEELQHLIRDPRVLFEKLELDESGLSDARAAHTLFPLKVTESFLSRIKKRSLSDPLLRQILPLGIEANDAPGYCTDPLQEDQFQPVPGLIHKYRSRVLLVTSSQCAIHCRYCFRRHFPYDQQRLDHQHWPAIVEYLQSKPEINEVILSGGDPLSASDRQLERLVEQIAKIAHIRRLRVHSRMPIILPSRVTQELLRALCGSRLKIIMVVHCNHAQEIDSLVVSAMTKFREAGMTLLNQSVLLKGVNDDAIALAELSESLFEAGVHPYYLHTLDRVSGAQHFERDERYARELYTALSAILPGYLMPKLVKEEPHKPAKTLIAPLD